MSCHPNGILIIVLMAVILNGSIAKIFLSTCPNSVPTFMLYYKSTVSSYYVPYLQYCSTTEHNYK